jgi:PAS domain S-box-containing protein
MTGNAEELEALRHQVAELEAALRESEERRSGLYNDAPIGFYRTTPDGRILMANPALLQMLGFSTFEELSARNLENEGFGPSCQRSVFMQRIEREGEIQGLETVWKKRNGSRLYIRENAKAVRAEDGHILYYEGTAEDVTERIRAEEALRQSERELVILNQIAQIFLTIADEDMYTEVLNIILAAFDSRLGVFGYIDENGALVVPSMKKHVWDQCRVADKKFTFPHETWGDSAWPRAIREKRAVWSNEPSTMTPAGHVPVRRHISMPIVHKGEVIGLLQVANRETDYTEEDVRALKSIADYVGPLFPARLERDRQEREHRRADEALHRIEWLLGSGHAPQPSLEKETASQVPAYGNLLPLNTSRVILDSVGKSALTDIARDYLDLLDTSAAIYERNGDYALGIFSSGWCRFMDEASRRLCGTADNREALASGKWLCHESCWTDASRKAIQTDGPVDIECNGGIRLYAIPVRAGDETVGSINIGYGDPPCESAKLQELASRYRVSADDLLRHAEAYESRPPFIIELAKRRLHVSARRIGKYVERWRAQEEMKRYHAQLEAANAELESFAYSVSHDLRAPLRAIDGFSQAIQEDYGDRLDDPGREYLEKVRSASSRMSLLIDDMLRLSKLTRSEMRREQVDLSALARMTLGEFGKSEPGRMVKVTVQDGLTVTGDPALLQVAMENLLSNAWKFTSTTEAASIEFGARNEDGKKTFFVRDNGVGFDQKYAGKLFGPFQRLHSSAEFPGTGIGLATVQRIINRHGGRVWAQAEPGKGATFCFTLE